MKRMKKEDGNVFANVILECLKKDINPRRTLEKIADIQISTRIALGAGIEKTELFYDDELLIRHFSKVLACTPECLLKDAEETAAEYGTFLAENRYRIQIMRDQDRIVEYMDILFANDTPCENNLSGDAFIDPRLTFWVEGLRTKDFLYRLKLSGYESVRCLERERGRPLQIVIGCREEEIICSASGFLQEKFDEILGVSWEESAQKTSVSAPSFLQWLRTIVDDTKNKRVSWTPVLLESTTYRYDGRGNTYRAILCTQWWSEKQYVPIKKEEDHLVQRLYIDAGNYETLYFENHLTDEGTKLYSTVEDIRDKGSETGAVLSGINEPAMLGLRDLIEMSLFDAG